LQKPTLLDRIDEIFATVQRPFIYGLGKARNLTRLT
jgi:hypothetical protein